MNDSSTDPYAPPSSEPSNIPHRSDDPGSLWRVGENVLLVRNLASLPDVCVYGSPETKPGSRQTFNFPALPPWIANLILIVLIFVVLTGRFNEPFLLIGSMILLALSQMLGKKVRVTFFRANAAAWRNLVGTFASAAGSMGIMGIILFSGNFTERLSTLPGGLRDLIMLAVTGLMMLIFHFFQAKEPRRVVARGGGWFELKGVAPAAIARLKAIQGAAPTITPADER